MQTKRQTIILNAIKLNTLSKAPTGIPSLMIALVLFQLVIGEHDIAAHDEFEQIRGIKKVVIEPDFSTR